MTHVDFFTDPVLLAVTALACARLTRLVSLDTITDSLRLHLSRWDWSRELVHCPWCVGVWVGIALAALLPPLWPQPVVVVLTAGLALSHLAGLLNTDPTS